MLDALGRFKRVKSSGSGWTAQCPAHEDKQNSLSIAQRDGKWLLKCHAGCKTDDVLSAVGLTSSDLFQTGEGQQRGEGARPSEQPRKGAGLTLEQYAAAKGLPIGFLRNLGLSEISYDRHPAVRIPYLGPDGAVASQPLSDRAER